MEDDLPSLQPFPIADPKSTTFHTFGPPLGEYTTRQLIRSLLVGTNVSLHIGTPHGSNTTEYRVSWKQHSELPEVPAVKSLALSVLLDDPNVPWEVFLDYCIDTGKAVALSSEEVRKDERRKVCEWLEKRAAAKFTHGSRPVDDELADSLSYAATAIDCHLNGNDKE